MHSTTTCQNYATHSERSMIKNACTWEPKLQHGLVV